MTSYTDLCTREAVLCYVKAPRVGLAYLLLDVLDLLVCSGRHRACLSVLCRDRVEDSLSVQCTLALSGLEDELRPNSFSRRKK